MNSTSSETAVQRCLDAYYTACDREDPNATIFLGEAGHNVRRAYRHAMPFLTSDPDAIDAFIACVSHGLVIAVFTESEAAKLLYAAQTAIAARRVRLQSDRAQSKLAALQVSATVAEQQPTPTPLPEAVHTAHPAGAPSLATASSSTGVGEQERTPSPLPQPSSTADAAANSPTCHVAEGDADPRKEEPAVPGTPPPSRPHSKKAQYEAILQQIYSGKVPIEDTLQQLQSVINSPAPQIRPPQPRTTVAA